MKQHYGLKMNELRALTTEELRAELSKWIKEQRGALSSQADLICQRVINRVVKVIDEKQ